MAPISGRTLTRRTLRLRDWIGIGLLLIPGIFFGIGLWIEGTDLGGPHMHWNITQIIALILHLPLGTAAVTLFLTGRNQPAYPESDAQDASDSDPVNT